jgi:hypothetical protein
MGDGEDLQHEIERIRTDGALGRSAMINRLFDYLAKSSLAGRSPKETEVAIEVFGRPPDFDPTRDAVARVYVHKLRRKLQDIARTSGTRLTIPRGAYRLVLGDERPADVARIPALRAPRRAFALAAAALVAVALLASGLTWAVLHPTAVLQGGRAATDPVWSPLLSNGFPTLIVVGDYYIFGEVGDRGATDRLIREYAINSRADLDRFIMNHPDRGRAYLDLGLTYLPTASAYGLLHVAPLLARDRRLQVIPASQLTPSMMKENNIVYIGYLSGLGILRDATLAGSRYAIGETYDEIVDSRTRRHYYSQGGGVRADGSLYRDYGYFSTFAGPRGNRFVIVAGTRDAALMQMAETATDAASLKAVIKGAGGARALEALFVIGGIDRSNLGGALITSSPLDERAIWSQDGRETFPPG